MAFDYTTRLPNQFEDATNLQILIGIMSALFEESNEILAYIRDDTTIDDGEGVWLDEIGDIVGVARGAGQRPDASIFAYCDNEDFPGDPLKGFSDLLDDPDFTGGHYMGVDGLPDGTEFSDADYRLLIRAKIASTYSEDTIPDMWQWIYDVFGVDAFVYTSGPAEIGVDLPIYMSHTWRRVLEKYLPRAAGVGFNVVDFPPYVPPGPCDEDDML